MRHSSLQNFFFLSGQKLFFPFSKKDLSRNAMTRTLKFFQKHKVFKGNPKKDIDI